MKKGKFKISFIKIAFVIISSIIISACSFQKDVNVKSIEIVEGSVPDFIIVGKFDEAGIQALITYEDDTTSIIDIDSNFLGDEYQKCINNSGEYEVEILFKGVSTKLTIKVVDMENFHVVKFFNGLNELVSMQFIEDGEDAVAPSGQSHQIYGYEFVGWDRTFTDVEEDINVYAIYTKVDKLESETINYHGLLMEAANNMRSSSLTILDIWELSAKRIETTSYYTEFNLDKVVSKVTEYNREINYNKYLKTINEERVSFSYEKYDSSGYYTKVDITEDEFNQYDIYSYVKKIVSSTDNLSYSRYHSLDKEFYKLVAVVPNNGDGGYDSETYEFLFSKEQIVYLKRFLNYKASNGTIENILTSTQYYTVNPSFNDKVVFPLDINLSDVTNNVYGNDVIITVEETRDYLVVVEETKNDADSKASLIVRDNVETYMWDKGEYTFYTKEEFGVSSTVKVYKTIESVARYGAVYYYKWKDISSIDPIVNVNEDGSVSFVFSIEESSTMRAHLVKFVVLNNKLIRFEKYYYDQNELIYIEKTTFSYEPIEVNIPSSLINGESSAIVE